MLRISKDSVPLTPKQRKLVDQNRGLVYKLVHRLYPTSPLAQRFGTEEDMLQEGMVCLCRAAKTYDPKQGVKFGTFAWKSIQAGIWRPIVCGGTVHIPDYARQKGSRYTEAAERAKYPRRLPQRWNQAEAITPDLADHDAIAKALELLDARQRQIVDWYFGLEGERPHTYQWIGRQLGVTRERVRQIIVTAYDVMRPLLTG
jgi:RNA polymerase sigma factor (sigma-70 family)